MVRWKKKSIRPVTIVSLYRASETWTSKTNIQKEKEKEAKTTNKQNKTKTNKHKTTTTKTKTNQKPISQAGWKPNATLLNCAGHTKPVQLIYVSTEFEIGNQFTQGMGTRELHVSIS